MKNVRLFWILGIVLALIGQSLCAQTKKEKKEQKEKEVKELIESKRFTIDVNRAIPMGGRSLNLTSPYSLEIAEGIEQYMKRYDFENIRDMVGLVK